MRTLRSLVLVVLAVGLLGPVPSVQAQASLVTPHAQEVLGDFDGDGRVDYGVYLDGQWYVAIGDRLGVLSFSASDPNARPVTVDIDGDGISDPGLFSPTSRSYVWLLSSSFDRDGWTGQATPDASIAVCPQLSCWVLPDAFVPPGLPEPVHHWPGFNGWALPPALQR